VVGDTIIDEYVYCEPLGQSLKQNLIVHQYLREERFCGGAVAVANQVAEFCKDVHLVTVFGQKNSFKNYVRQHLRSNISMHAFSREDAPTVVKRRYLYANAEQKVFEVCHILDRETPQHMDTALAQYVGGNAANYDLVMICDYGHGAVTHRVANEAKHTAKFLAVNAQTNSANMGYNLITRKYSGLNYACVDEAEARLALQDKHETIEAVGVKLLHRLDADRLIITRGRHGSITFMRDGTPQATPAFAMNVVDRVGAGDVFFAVTSPCFSTGMSPDLVSFIGNAAGALAVQIVGNRETVAPRDLYGLISALLS
jgi:rfaE bifunctional protein kinase chain/domain